VRAQRILPYLDKGDVAIVAGFQGVSLQGEITTLGRGGSDTSAVALAIAFRAKKVEFYKDVQGIFSKDPKIDPSAELYSVLDYQEVLELINDEKVKVLHPRAIKLAEKNHIPLHVLTFREEGGSLGTTVLRGNHLPNERLLYERDI